MDPRGPEAEEGGSGVRGVLRIKDRVREGRVARLLKKRGVAPEGSSGEKAREREGACRGVAGDDALRGRGAEDAGEAGGVR